ncbi:hypothetical protein D3C87_1041330 [compost metagenome]
MMNNLYKYFRSLNRPLIENVELTHEGMFVRLLEKQDEDSLKSIRLYIQDGILDDIVMYNIVFKKFGVYTKFESFPLFTLLVQLEKHPKDKEFYEINKFFFKLYEANIIYENGDRLSFEKQQEVVDHFNLYDFDLNFIKHPHLKLMIQLEMTSKIADLHRTDVLIRPSSCK